MTKLDSVFRIRITVTKAFLVVYSVVNKLKKQMFRVILYLLILKYFGVKGDNTFNYDVGIRVNDKIADYLEMISKAASLPLIVAEQKLLNFSNTAESCPVLFYPSMIQYGDLISKFYWGLETGLFCSYGFVGTKLFMNLIPNCPPGKCIRSRYNIDPTSGVPLSYANSNVSYDARTRPWYKQAKTFSTSFWTAPYLDAISGAPVITIATPVLNQSIMNKQYSFTGAIGVDVFLTDVSRFLVNSFHGTNRMVFIIDALTGNLIGNSMGVATSLMTSAGLSFVQAENSADSTVSGATQLLMSQNFPNRLLLFNQYYLESVKYNDNLYGLQWYIVVLMPAAVEDDHLGPNNSQLYMTSLVLSSFALFVAVISLLLTIFYWKQKIVKLCQPWLLSITLCGNIVLSIMTLFLVGENTLASCTIRPYLFAIGWTISFTPILFKSTKANLVLNQQQFAKISFRDHWIAFLLIACVGIDVLLLTTTLYTGDAGGTSPVTATVLTSSGAYAPMTYCGYHTNAPLAAALLSYKGLVILLACYTSFKARNVPDALGGSKVLMVIIYVTAFIATITMLLVGFVADILVGIFCECVAVTIFVVMTSCLLTGPWLFAVFFMGDTEAVDLVLSDLQQNRQKSKSCKVEVNNGKEEVNKRRPALLRVTSGLTASNKDIFRTSPVSVGGEKFGRTGSGEVNIDRVQVTMV